MLAHTRAVIAASAFAMVTGHKVAGLYDHGEARHLRIAAEARGKHLQGFDGDRGAKFGGTLPELYDTKDETYVSFDIEGTTVKGYDRASSSSYTANVGHFLVQLYDHTESAWFTFDINVIEY